MKISIAVSSITYLQMTDPQQLRPKEWQGGGLEIERSNSRDWRLHRELYQRVGEDWQWCDKLTWSGAQWQDYAGDPGLHLHLARLQGELVGYFELQQISNEVQIAYFGLLPAFIGKGLGGPLLTGALREAWALGAKRVWVHTCDLDHPAALANYQARGMEIYKTELARSTEQG